MSEELEKEVMIVESSMAQTISRAEIDMQISTAHKYPRSIRRFMDDVATLATLSQEVAEECSYALKRDGKVIEGPSARFAEIVQSCWGNSRAGARVVNDDGRFVTAQGVYHDLERNVAVTFEVRRRVTGKNGNRYSDDMIAVTGNAASSIALRNAVLKGIPSPIWKPMWEKARQVARGDFQSLSTRRANALERLRTYGVDDAQIFAYLGIKGAEEISLDHLDHLRGLVMAFREGDTTPEETFIEGATISGTPARSSTPPKPTAKPAPKAEEKPKEEEAIWSFDAYAKEVGTALEQAEDMLGLAEAWETKAQPPRALKAAERKVLEGLYISHQTRLQNAGTTEGQAEEPDEERQPDETQSEEANAAPAEPDPERYGTAMMLGGVAFRNKKPRNAPAALGPMEADAWLWAYDNNWRKPA